MGKKDFELWLDSIFEHEVDNYKPIWYQVPGFYENLSGHEESAINNLIKLFTETEKYLDKYSDAQIGLGLWYLFDHSASDYPLLLKSPELSWELKEKYLQSIETLYKDYFAKKCTNTFSHLSVAGNPVNSPCYMLWDLFFLPDGNLGERCREICLEIMRNTLKINNIACQESALHGLGHWFISKPKEVEKIIQDFLKNKSLEPKIINYALSAKSGCVL